MQYKLKTGPASPDGCYPYPSSITCSHQKYFNCFHSFLDSLITSYPPSSNPTLLEPLSLSSSHPCFYFNVSLLTSFPQWVCLAGFCLYQKFSASVKHISWRQSFHEFQNPIVIKPDKIFTYSYHIFKHTACAFHIKTFIFHLMSHGLLRFISFHMAVTFFTCVVLMGMGARPSGQINGP